MNRRPKIQKLSKTDKMLLNKQQKENAFKGSGIYVFENNINADLMLPKATLGNQKIIPPKGKFRGDSFFLSMVKTNTLRLIEVIQSEEDVLKIANESINKEGDNMNNKLLLDQPAIITDKGTVEHVQVVSMPNNKNENLNIGEKEENKNILLVEDPIGSIELIND